MHIAMFTNNYRPFVGGVPISIDSFANEFRERGHQVTIFAPEYKKTTEDEENIFRVPSLKMIKYGNSCLPIPLSGLSNLKKEFAKLNIDIVHCHHPFFLGRVGQKLGHKYNIPIVYTYHTRYKEYCHHLPIGIDKFCEAALDKIVENFCNNSDLVFAPTQGMTNYLFSIGVNTQIKVIPTGIDLSHYDQIEINDYQSQLQATNDDILLFVSRLSAEKNIDFLLKSLEPVLNSKEKLKLLIVGDGPEKENLIELSVELGVKNQVEFLGKKNREELIKLYKLSDIFVFSSLSETQGMVITEALAGKTPVVALNGTGVKDIIIDGKDGYLLAPDDKRGFANKVTKLLNDRDLLDEMSLNALEKANQYSIQNLAQDMLKYYHSLCNFRANYQPEFAAGQR
ncbi:glycosyltransferase [Selenihalanaerobacter shriftii]|uniref:Glycosyltransferase involved in cell wall bisynthesis n=1 Tax=Selenihalanaerobacter shriftii TaxID=142842 RepID=A0A1T4LWN6_9FIRM|nr:glycosyltransferase [Selenihalanaerobacter shriftii]SJZ59159.1 Glycosyltransferase involved in cell wall bisynthesis [Selenihalanaerobacter shriftii]